MVKKPGATVTPDEIKAHLAKSFAKWQLPEAVVFIEAIPRTSTGKFQKLALHERFKGWDWNERKAG